MKIFVKDRLMLEDLCCQLLYSYNLIAGNLVGWEQLRAFAGWRLEVFEYIMQAKPSQLNFMCEYLSKQDSKVFLEFMTLVTDYAKEPKQGKVKPSKIHSIMNYIRRVIKPTRQSEYKIAR